MASVSVSRVYQELSETEPPKWHVGGLDETPTAFVCSSQTDPEPSAPQWQVSL